MGKRYTLREKHQQKFNNELASIDSVHVDTQPGDRAS